MKLPSSFHMNDYEQPEFYRFNEDSLLLVKEIVAENPKAMNVLDIGAGSGIIGIELSNKLHIPLVHFVELQREWEAYLTANIKDQLKHAQSEVFWTSVGEWTPAIKYDLIVGNPPYYLPGKGKTSPDPVRGKCRMFLKDSWKVLLEKSAANLTPNGSAWFVTLKENENYIQKMAGNLNLEIRDRGEVILLKCQNGISKIS